jgi:S1-C subfamily serine protease
MAAIAAFLTGTNSASGTSESASKHLGNSALFALGASQTVMMLNPDNESSGGTGFAVRAPSGKLYTMTNAHVCNITDRPYLLASRGGAKLRLQIIEVMEQADLCILQGIPFMNGLDVADGLDLYDGVYVVGHPRLQPINMTAGWVRTRGYVAISYCNVLGSKLRVQLLPDRRRNAKPLLDLEEQESCIKEMDAIMTNNDSQPGNSGSAVLNDRGQVVGVLFAGDSNGTSLIVPLLYLKEMLANY